MTVKQLRVALDLWHDDLIVVVDDDDGNLRPIARLTDTGVRDIHVLESWRGPTRQLSHEFVGLVFATDEHQQMRQDLNTVGKL